MLYLNPPYHIIDGVSLLPDHADPLQFYYLPLSPHLSTITDPATGQEIPQLQVVMYAGDGATGGFLNFDCNLGVTEAQLGAVRQQLRDRQRLRDEPKLAPVPLVDGTVRLMLLGKESAPPDAEKPKPPPAGSPPPPPSGPQFVLKIAHNAQPSLYGDNQAAFSVQLDAAGVTLLEQALHGEMSPIGVVYSLTYVALRPAYNVHVVVDWNRVQSHVSQSSGVNTLFYSSQIDHIVDKLVEDRVIVIEGDLFVADGDGGDDVQSRYDQALSEVKEMVTETFFEPSLEPIGDDQPGGDFAAVVERTSKLAATGGMGSLFTQREVDLTRIDRKTLSATFSERTAVRRSIHPQGHLGGLFRMIEQQRLDPARFILRAGLDHPFFRRRKVRVIPYVDFAPSAEPDLAQSINVSLTYEGDTRNVVIDAAHPGEQSVEWASVLDGDVMRKDVEVAYRVNFAPTPAVGRPLSVQSPKRTLDGDALTIGPRGDLYAVRTVVVNCIDYPWRTYGLVELDCAYEDRDNGIDESAHFVLGPQTVTQFTWSVFALDPARRAVRYRLVHHGVDGRDVDTGWLETDEELIRIGDPHPRKRTLAIVAPASLFATVDRAFVDVAYDDRAHGVAKRESFEVDASNAATRTFTVELLDPGRRQVEFKVTFLMQDGRTVEVPLSYTLSERIFLSATMRGHRAVDVRPEPIEFAPKGLKEILVETTYTDATAQLSFAGDVRLTKPADAGSFEFDYVDISRDAYRYRITHHYTNGLSRTTDWQESDAPELVVPVG